MNSTEIFGARPADSQTADSVRASLEDLEAAFGTPTQRQDYYEPQPAPGGEGDSLPASLITPDGNDGTTDDIPADPEAAQRTGMRIARIADTSIDFVLSNFVAHNDESYRASEGDLADIAQAWGEMAQEKGWSMGPGTTLAVLYLMVYGPLVKQAFTDRRIAEMEARQRLMEQQQEELKQRIRNLEDNGKQNGQPDDGPQA